MKMGKLDLINSMSMMWKKKGIKRQGNLKTGENYSQRVTDYNTYSFTVFEWLKYSLIALAVLSVFIYVFYKSLFIFIFLAPFCFLYPKFKRKELMESRKRRLIAEFKDAIMILSSLISAGYSLENGIGETLTELRLLYTEDALIIKEFEYIKNLIFMNVSVEKAFDDFAYRSHCEDIRSFAKVLRIAKRSGGELRNIIAHTVSVISDKVRIKEEIITMTAPKNLIL